MSEVAEKLPISERIYQRLAGLGKSAKCGVSDWRKRKALESLEQSLAKIITTANGHAARKVARGSGVYIELEERATAKIQEFCAKWGMSERSVRAQAPALDELHQLTIAVANPGPLWRGIGFVLAGMFAVAVLATVTGMFQAIQHWIYHILTWGGHL